MKGEQREAIIEQVGCVHHALTDMMTNMNLALEMVDILTPADQTQLEEYWQ